MSSPLPQTQTPTDIAGSYRAQYNLAFQISPIILQGGIAPNNGLLPIIYLYNQQGLFSTNADPNAFFAQYLPLPGSTLISNTIGTYPFANQQVAANAIIQQPLTLSMLMIAPVNQAGGYLQKLATFTALQGSLNAHCIAGGTFSIATPAFIYNNIIMTGMTDITHGGSNQQQIQWQLDFVKPLVTIQDAAAAQNSFISKVTNGGQVTNPGWSGLPYGASPVLNGLSGAITQFGGTLPGSGS